MPAVRPRARPRLATLSCALLLGVAIPAPGAAAASPVGEAIAALPELGRIEGGHAPVVLRGQLRPARARRAQQVATWVVQDMQRRFLRSGGPVASEPIAVCLFDDDASYEAFAAQLFGAAADHSPWGFYLPSARLVVANLHQSVGNLRHELAHALLGDDFPEIPAWLNEGIGALYGTARHQAGGYRFLVNYRLRHLAAAQQRGAVPTWAQLARSSSEDVYGPDALTYYATARYLLLYLDRRGQLGDFYRALRDLGASPAQQLSLLEATVDRAAFLAWAERQRHDRRRAS